MSIPKIALIGLVLVATQSGSVGLELGTAPCQEQVIYNALGAPVRLKMSPNGKYVEVTNHSDKEVKALKFGCVVATTDGPVVKKTIESMEHFDLAHIDLAAEQEKSRMNTFAFTTRDEIVRQCKGLDSLLALVEVKFADGSSWETPGTKKKAGIE